MADNLPNLIDATNFQLDDVLLQEFGTSIQKDAFNPGPDGKFASIAKLHHFDVDLERMQKMATNSDRRKENEHLLNRLALESKGSPDLEVLEKCIIFGKHAMRLIMQIPNVYTPDERQKFWDVAKPLGDSLPFPGTTEKSVHLFEWACHSSGIYQTAPTRGLADDSFTRLMFKGISKERGRGILHDISELSSKAVYISWHFDKPVFDRNANYFQALRDKPEEERTKPKPIYALKDTPYTTVALNYGQLSREGLEEEGGSHYDVKDGKKGIATVVSFSRLCRTCKGRKTRMGFLLFLSDGSVKVVWVRLKPGDQVVFLGGLMCHKVQSDCEDCEEDALRMVLFTHQQVINLAAKEWNKVKRLPFGEADPEKAQEIYDEVRTRPGQGAQDRMKWRKQHKNFKQHNVQKKLERKANAALRKTLDGGVSRT
ncbi:hypothetical protein HDU93_002548 [Gonapodya sp. JEL0774]|nr:hypothetical protein HDU93_002548 [Gonapodya sp. JEL0774]